MVDASAVRGLYVITDTTVNHDDALVSMVRQALEGGAAVVQYRDKSDAHERRRREAEALLALCRQYRALLVINDDVELAAAIGAPAVHLGRDDDDPARARARLGSHVVIGVSCYGSLERADQLTAAGADYLAFGSVFPSPTKPEAVAVPLATLAIAAERYRQPLVAIGGITPDNAGPVVAAGVDAVAVISGVFAAPDPRLAAARITALFDSGAAGDA